MRWFLRAALLIFIAPLPAVGQSSLEPARSAIDACTQRLDPQVDIGYERIAARCPDLARALERSEFEQWLPAGWKESRNNLSPGSLKELRAVVERELATRPGARIPRVERLNEVLASLGKQREEGGGIWSRFRNWLRELMDRRDSDERAGWFDRLVSRVGISDAVIEVISYLALGAMVALAGVVVLNELKAAGLLGRRGKSTRDERPGHEISARPVPAFSEIEQAPLRDRPRMLVELISSKLTALRRLPPASAFTVRELTKLAKLPTEEDRRRLASVALAAERERYAAGGVPATVLESAFEQGRELLKSVESLRVAEPVDGAAA
jgi:hypothetical protein